MNSFEAKAWVIRVFFKLEVSFFRLLLDLLW